MPRLEANTTIYIRLLPPSQYNASWIYPFFFGFFTSSLSLASIGSPGLSDGHKRTLPRGYRSSNGCHSPTSRCSYYEFQPFYGRYSPFSTPKPLPSSILSHIPTPFHIHLSFHVSTCNTKNPTSRFSGSHAQGNGNEEEKGTRQTFRRENQRWGFFSHTRPKIEVPLLRRGEIRHTFSNE